MTKHPLLRSIRRHIIARKQWSFQEWLYFRRSVLGVHGAIRIVSLIIGTGSAPKDQKVVKAAQAALTLIEQTDPAAYRMIEREVSYVIASYLMGGGQYRRKGKICYIAYEQYRIDPTDPDYEWWIARLASTIVHEAMHGRLYSLGISYNKQTRERVERLCVLREQQFARRLQSDSYDFATLVKPFDPSRWQIFWDGSTYRKWRKEKLVEIINRVKKMFQK